MEHTLTTLLGVFNVALGLVLFGLGVRIWVRDPESPLWLVGGYLGLGVGWVILYVYILSCPNNYTPGLTSHVFRALVTMTLSFLISTIVVERKGR